MRVAVELRENCAIAPGTTMIDCANTIGITPAVLMRSGMKLRAASRIRPRAMVRCGIWMRMRRAAIVIATTPATTATMIAASTTSENAPSAPVVTKRKVVPMRGEGGATMEKKGVGGAGFRRARGGVGWRSDV